MSQYKRTPKKTEDVLIVGRNPVLEALEDSSVQLDTILIQSGIQEKVAQKVLQRAKLRGIPVKFVPSQQIQRIAGKLNHQGLIATAPTIPYRDMDEMLSEIAPSYASVQEQKPTILLLDQIEDPHNFGAILRSAVASGVNGIVVPEKNMAPLSATTIKASAGTAWRIPIARVANLSSAIHQLKERGYWIAGLEGTSETTIWDMDWERPLVIVVGNEGRGMRHNIKLSCDYLISIPMKGAVESLNASVATGIVLFAASRERV